MPVKSAKKAKRTAVPKNETKKLTPRQRSLRAKKAWAERKARLKAEEEQLFNGGPTLRKAQVEDDGPPHEEHPLRINPDAEMRFGDYVTQKRYYISQGNTIIDFSAGPLKWSDMIIRMNEMFQADPRLENVLILEVANISFKRTHQIKLSQPGGKEETLTLNK